jgi:ketosteroid isomerase-like protein
MHPNEILARREIDLINAEDFEALDDLYTDDLIVHYPGKNPLAGSHPVQEFLARFQAVLQVPTITLCNSSTSPPR